MCGGLHRKADQIRFGPNPKASIFRLNIRNLNVRIIDTIPALSAPLTYLYTQYGVHHTICILNPGHCIINELLHTYMQDKPETQFANQRSHIFAHTINSSFWAIAPETARRPLTSKKNCRFRWATRLYAHHTSSIQKKYHLKCVALFFRPKLGPFNFFSINNSMA